MKDESDSVDEYEPYSSTVNFHHNIDDIGLNNNNRHSSPFSREASLEQQLDTFDKSFPSSSTELRDPFAEEMDEEDFKNMLLKGRGPGGRAMEELDFGPAGNRMSLAAELESAHSSSSNRELWMQLGLDDDDGEGRREEDEEEPYSDEEEEESYGDVSRVEDDNTATQWDSPAVRSSGKAGVSRQRVPSFASSSSSSLYHDQSGSPSTQSTPPRSRDESDSDFLIINTALEEDLGATDQFLQHLRSQASSGRNKDRTNIEDVGSRSGEFPDVASTYSDRQDIVETSATSFLRRLVELEKIRRSQVKELDEMERLASKLDRSGRNILGELNIIRNDAEVEVENFAEVAGTDLDEDEDTHYEATTPVASTFSIPARISIPLPTAEDPYEDVEDELTATTPTRSRHHRISSPPLPDLDPSSSHSSQLGLSNLRTVTASLISALSVLNESSQINHAALGDAGRKLRSLRVHLGTVKEDLAGLTQAEEFVKLREGAVVGQGGKQKGSCGIEAKEWLKTVEEELEKASATARNLLKERG